MENINNILGLLGDIFEAWIFMEQHADLISTFVLNN